MQKETDRLIEVYRSGRLTRKEADKLAEWLEQTDENRMYFRIRLAEREIPVSAAAREWARFAARNKFLFEAPTFKTSRWRQLRLYAAAAVVMLIAGGSLWFWSASTRPPVSGEGLDATLVAQTLEFRTTRGEKRDIVLPDSSTSGVRRSDRSCVPPSR